MKYWKIFLILAVGIVAGVAFVYSCGGGGGGDGGEDGGCTGGSLNSLFNGDYMSVVRFDRDDGGPDGRLFDFTADGDGNAIAYINASTEDLSYAIAADRTMCIGPVVAGAGSFVTCYGIIRGDGSILALTDADGGPSLRDTEISVSIAKSSIIGTAGIAGTFIIGQIDEYDGISRIRATINSDTESGSWEVLASENQSQVGDTGSLVLVFSADGTFTIDNGIEVKDGIISPDLNVFAMGDTIAPRTFAVGVRLSAAGTPDGIGDYIINQIGFWEPLGEHDPYVSRTDLTIGVATFDFQVTANSLGLMDSGTGIAYSVSADGTVRFPGNSGWVANLSPDGEVMVLVDADPATANDLHMGVAIKK